MSLSFQDVDADERPATTTLTVARYRHLLTCERENSDLQQEVRDLRALLRQALSEVGEMSEALRRRP